MRASALLFPQQGDQALQQGEVIRNPVGVPAGRHVSCPDSDRKESGELGKLRRSMRASALLFPQQRGKKQTVRLCLKIGSGRRTRATNWAERDMRAFLTPPSDTQRRWRGEHQGRKESCRPPNQDWVTPRERKAVLDSRGTIFSNKK